jgi:hypothetical protein
MYLCKFFFYFVVACSTTIGTYPTSIPLGVADGTMNKKIDGTVYNRTTI